MQGIDGSGRGFPPEMLKLGEDLLASSSLRRRPSHGSIQRLTGTTATSPKQNPVAKVNPPRHRISHAAMLGDLVLVMAGTVTKDHQGFYISVFARHQPSIEIWRNKSTR